MSALRLYAWITGVGLCVVAVVVAVMVLSGHERTDPRSGTDFGMEDPTVTAWEQPPLPEPFTKLDQSDPVAVAEAASREFFHFDPRHDTSIRDAPERVKPLMTPEFYDSHRNSLAGAIYMPGYVWENWVKQRATITVTAKVQADNHPEDTSARWARVVEVNVKSSTGDEWIYSVYITLESRGWWRIADMTIPTPKEVSHAHS